MHLLVLTPFLNRTNYLPYISTQQTFLVGFLLLKFRSFSGLFDTYFSFLLSEGQKRALFGGVRDSVWRTSKDKTRIGLLRLVTSWISKDFKFKLWHNSGKLLKKVSFWSELHFQIQFENTYQNLLLQLYLFLARKFKYFKKNKARDIFSDF